MKETDHDLLVELKTRMEDIRKDIQDLKDGTSIRISDHEKRISLLEKSNITTKVAVGIYLAIGVFLAGLMIYHIIGD
jgi:hypothetical protein